MRLLLLLIGVTAMSALAIRPGDTLYVRAKDTPLLKEPKAKSPSVDKLQPGAEVTWVGPSAKDPQFHEVASGAKKGFVHRGDLSPFKPQSEVDTTSGKPMSAAAFASSGAATKSPPPQNVSYRGNPASEAAAAELLYLEALNEQKATPQALTAKSKELHGL